MKRDPRVVSGGRSVCKGRQYGCTQQEEHEVNTSKIVQRTRSWNTSVGGGGLLGGQLGVWA